MARPSRAQRGFIRAEPFFIYPYLGVGVGYNDNLVGTPNDRISSAFLLLSAHLRTDVKSGGDTYALTYNGTYGHYLSSSANDFNEQAIVATSSNQFTERADLQAAAFTSSSRILSVRSTGRSIQLRTAGTDGARMRRSDMAHNRHKGGWSWTLAPPTSGTRTFARLPVFDLTTWDVAARFYYRIAPATRLLAEIRDTEYDYRSSPLNNNEQRYLLGATWDVTAATSGTLKLGYVATRFKQEGLDDYSGLTVEAALRWLPRTYSTVEIVALYAPSQSTGTGKLTVDTTAGARWEHYWKSYFLTRAYATYVNSDYQGISRTDHVSRVGIGAYFDLRSWLRIGADFSHENRNTNVFGFDFSRNVIILSIAGTL